MFVVFAWINDSRPLQRRCPERSVIRPMLWWFRRSLWQQAMTNWLVYLNFINKFQYRLWISLSQIVVDGISCFVTSFFLPDQFEALQEELDRRRQECLQLKVFRLHLNHSCKQAAPQIFHSGGVGERTVGGRGGASLFAWRRTRGWGTTPGLRDSEEGEALSNPTDLINHAGC